MKKLGMVVVMLTMVAVAIVPALAQDGEFNVTPAEEPVATCAWGPTEVALRRTPTHRRPGPLRLRAGRALGYLRVCGGDVGVFAGKREGN